MSYNTLAQNPINHGDLLHHIRYFQSQNCQSCPKIQNKFLGCLNFFTTLHYQVVVNFVRQIANILLLTVFTIGYRISLQRLLVTPNPTKVKEEVIKILYWV